MTLLATCLRRGWGAARDPERAAELLQAAAALGSALAMGQLGVCYEKGEGVSQDEGAAAKWARLAAEGGDPTGMCNLGVYLQHGIGARARTQRFAFRCSAPALAKRCGLSGMQRVQGYP